MRTRHAVAAARRFLVHCGREHQRRLPFLERTEGLERRFKRAIAGLTLAAVCAVVLASPLLRYNVLSALLQTRSTTARWLGLPPDRWAIDAEWRVRRSYQVATTRRTYRSVYAAASPATRKLLDYGGLSPDDAVFRWGNYNQLFVLPSKVFAPDDAGRSYRMRPHTRSVWL